MLQISSTTPASSATNVLRDASIDITFDKEVKATTVNISNFILYKKNGAVYVNQVSLGLSQETAVVHMAPVEDLDANTTYEAIVLGDSNPADATPRGVIAIDDEVMNGNYVFTFTTGEMRHIDIEGGASASDSATASGEALVLSVVSTDPEDYETQVTAIPTVDVTFDRYVTALDGSDSIAITSRGLVFGMDTYTPSAVSVSYSTDHKTALFAISGAISSNTEYLIDVYADSMSGSLNAQMAADYSFRFYTQMYPYYTDPATVRRRGGHLISSTLEDWLIDMYILDASIWVSDTLGVGFLTGDSITRAITELTTCKVILDIAYGVANGTLKGVRSKQLADLRIEYDYRAGKDAIQRFEDCVTAGLLAFGEGPYQTGVKSGESDNYPERRSVLWSE